MGDALFAFSQFEFPWLLGPAPGRYVARDKLGEAPASIIVIAELGASPRRGLRGRRMRRAPPEPHAEPVATGRATVVDATPLGSEQEAERWLRGTDLGPAADAALSRLARAVQAHRIAAADPSVPTVTRTAALVVRVGFGSGEQLAEGRWRAAHILPRARPRHTAGDDVATQERMAALLGARDAALACEELALRARSDVDAGRDREAALQVRATLEAALAELPAYTTAHSTIEERLGHLRACRAGVETAARAALAGGLAPEQSEHVTMTLRRIEAALRGLAASR